MKLPSLLLLVALCGCVAASPRSHALNPLGWPGHGIEATGRLAADSEVPLVQELGRVLVGAGELLDAPALLVEGLITGSGDRLVGGGELLVVGVGETTTAALNLPFCVFVAAHVDLGREADAINGALAWTEQPATADTLFPVGTRVRASGRNLIWSCPGRAEVLQRAEGSLQFYLTLLASGDSFVAQERSWGFVVPSVGEWNDRSDRQRTLTTMHEFWHQQKQMRDMFLGWTTLYWPAYLASFLRHGWYGHWAETGPSGAQKVEQALREWSRK